MNSDTAKQLADNVLESYRSQAFLDLEKRPHLAGHHQALIRTIGMVPEPVAAHVQWVDRQTPGMLAVTDRFLYILEVDLASVEDKEAAPPIKLRGHPLQPDHHTVTYMEGSQRPRPHPTWTFDVGLSEPLEVATIVNEESTVDALRFAVALSGQLGWDATVGGAGGPAG